jgi:hypothetical protein
MSRSLRLPFKVITRQIVKDQNDGDICLGLNFFFNHINVRIPWCGFQSSTKLRSWVCRILNYDKVFSSTSIAWRGHGLYLPNLHLKVVSILKSNYWFETLTWKPTIQMCSSNTGIYLRSCFLCYVFYIFPNVMSYFGLKRVIVQAL